MKEKKQKNRCVSKSDLMKEYISIASHQLRGPMASLKWYGDLLAKGDSGKLNKKQKEYVKRMNKSTEHLISLVNDFLDVSTIELGEVKFKKIDVDIPKLVKNIINNNKYLLHQKTVKSRFRNELKKNILNIDAELVREIYSNIVSNAVKYSKRGGMIRVRLYKKGKELILEVKDSGLGIPEDEQQNITNKFFRASNALKSGTKGTGLGLYTTWLLLQKIDGKIWFESKKGKGSTFWVSIPTKLR